MTRSTVTRRLAAGLVTLAVALLTPTAVLARGHSHPAHHGSSRRSAAQPAAAGRLAEQLAHAKSPSAKDRALLRILEALHVGVYTGSGRAIQRGAERGVGDFYLYDFEVRAVAHALARRQSYRLSDLAALLSKASGRTITADQLAVLLHAGVRAALAKASDPSSLLPLLVRDLGRRDRPASDPARRFTPSSLRLDAAQYFLLSASFLGETLRRAGERGGARAAAADAGGPCPRVQPDPNTPPQVENRSLGWWDKKRVKDATPTIAAAFSGAKGLVGNLLAALHGSVLAYSLRLEPVGGNLATHYGPAGAGLAPDAGQPMDFRLRAKMLDDLGETTIKCLALAGIKLPAQGAIPGVPVLWEYPQGNLLQDGTVVPQGNSLGSRSVTGSDGIAHLTFTPNDELVPGLGVETRDTGVVDGIAQWQDAFGNSVKVLGVKLGLNQYLTPIYSGIRWDVGYHNQLGTLHVSSDRSNHWDTTGPAPLYEHETGAYAYGLDAVIPFAATGGGSAALTWTTFSQSAQDTFPNGSGQCYGTGKEIDQSFGQNPQPGNMTVQQITGQPNISVTLGITPASYNVHEVDTTCAGNSFSDSTATTDGGFQAVSGQQGVTTAGTNTYRITGWTPGAPGSGVFATKTITLSDGTITLVITPRFG